ncbi:flavodoxin [Anaerotignum faecicola]|jgi:flavodoxin I|nr:flavodoxin [Tyzzerella sp.]
MKKAVIYWSGTGNTAAMASAIAAGMGEGTELYSVDQFTGDIADYDKIAFGCSAMGDEVLEEAEFDPFFTSIEGKLGGKKVALFGSYGWGDGQWMRDWAERTTKAGANLYDDGLMVNGFPDGDAKVQCTAFGEGFGAY